jgi:hypothetical protein
LLYQLGFSIQKEKSEERERERERYFGGDIKVKISGKVGNRM